ncbi:MAG: hypothetical protein J4F45_10975, partial [Pseudomonadales bacterium]|nr:hypothetical protein [Pseudomonadales bacterium]
DPDFREWPQLMLNWLRRCGFLTGKARHAVSGRVTLNGEAMGMAWVTFVPLDSNAPPARARASHAEKGRFEIPASHGVVPGPHRVEVRVPQHGDVHAGRCRQLRNGRRRRGEYAAAAGG